MLPLVLVQGVELVCPDEGLGAAGLGQGHQGQQEEQHAAVRHNTVSVDNWTYQTLDPVTVSVSSYCNLYNCLVTNIMTTTIP